MSLKLDIESNPLLDIEPEPTTGVRKNFPPGQKPGEGWRRYPAVSKGLGPREVRLHDHDGLSTRPPSPEAAKVIASVLALRPARPPGK